MNIHKRKKWISVYLAIILFVAAWMPNIMQAEASETRTIRVAFPVQEGMSTFHQDGTPDGYSYMYLEKIAEYTGWKIEYVPYDDEDSNKNIQNAMADLQSGKVDLMGPLLKSESMEAMFSFPEQSYGIVYTTLCALETSDIREDNAASQNPLKVGLWRQAETRNSEVVSYLETQNFNYELYYYETSEEQKQALEDGEVDVISNVSLSKISGTRIIERFAPRPYYFASSKENTELIQELDEAISIINQVQPSLQDTLFDKYFRDTRYTFAPTEQQKEYLASLKELRVICVDEDAPYVYQRDGKPAGMLIEVLEDFSKETGVNIKYTFCADRSEAEQKIAEEKYDVMIGSPFTSKYCAEIGFVRSKSIIESSLAYLHNPENTKHDTVAVKRGLEDLVDTLDFETILFCESDMECIEAVTSGKADYAIGDRSGLEYYMYDTYSTLVTSQVSGEIQNICIAIARDSDLQLIRVLNDYIYSLSDLQKNTFLEAGNVHEYKATLKSYVRLHPTQAVLIAAIVTGIVAAAIFMMIHAKKMHRKNAELEKANVAKSEFLTRMSHDIRTPMNGIVGLLDISDKFVDDPVMVKKYHQRIRMASEYLLSLLNDVLDMSKLDSDEIVFAENSIYLREIMENCRDILGAKAAEQGIKLETPGMDEFNPPRVIASEMHLRQIVMNVVSNAIKYNKPNGKIIATTEVIAQTEDAVTCRFAVEDTGIGMSESFQKQMFMPFSQEHGENRSEFKGTGLGLSIVKRIIDKMGGEIHVESKKGEGTKFVWTLTFQIDKEYQEKEKEIKAANIDFTGKHILAAEDNALNAEILVFLLEDVGAEVTLVENGKLAVEAFEQSETGSYDCILLDVMMPVMDGYTASRKIRELSRSDAKTVPIIALTANAFAEDVQKSMEAGMNAHITKPIDINKLKECMARLLFC